MGYTLIEEKEYDDICNWLNGWAFTLKQKNKQHLFDSNTYAEKFVCRILNPVYGYNLRDLNSEQQSFPGIDLGNKETGISVQISANVDAKKVNESYDKLNNRSIDGVLLKDIFNKPIIFFEISEKRTITPAIEKNIKKNHEKFSIDQVIDISTFLAKVNSLRETSEGMVVFKKVYEEVKKAFADGEYISDEMALTEILGEFKRQAFTAYFTHCGELLSRFETGLMDTKACLLQRKHLDGTKLNCFSKEYFDSSEVEKEVSKLAFYVDRLRNDFVKYGRLAYPLYDENNNLFGFDNPAFTDFLNVYRGWLIFYVEKIIDKYSLDLKIYNTLNQYNDLPKDYFTNNDKGDFVKSIDAEIVILEEKLKDY